MINLHLSIDETNQLLAFLGEQPIKTGLHDLTQKIKTQGEEQLRALNESGAATACSKGSTSPCEATDVIATD